jgi:hypothetical protein
MWMLASIVGMLLVLCPRGWAADYTVTTTPAQDAVITQEAQQRQIPAPQLVQFLLNQALEPHVTALERRERQRLQERYTRLPPAKRQEIEDSASASVSSQVGSNS